MNVLSLFDGISCGRLALDRAGTKYDNYFASEVDESAIRVAQHNYHDTVQLGDVSRVKASELPKIHLLIGGSPCQGFSFAGKGLNFEDPRSKLFFEFVRLLEECHPDCFLLENVKMKKEYHDVISERLGTEPVEIDSNLVSAQNRKRLYWTNIPDVVAPKDRKIFLKDIVDFHDTNRKTVDKSRIKSVRTTKNYVQYDLSGKGYGSQDQRCYFLHSKHGTLPSRGGSSKTKVVWTDGSFVHLTPKECERLQTVPDGYTETVKDGKRYELLGNCWTVDVIAHIFEGLSKGGGRWI